MNIVLLIVSFFIGLFFYSQIIFTIFYFFPKSIILVIRRELKPISIISSLRTPIFYFIVLFLIGFFFPSVLTNQYLINPYVAIGSNLSIVALLYRGFITKKGRGELKEDYDKFIEKYKTKLNYEDWVELGNSLYKDGKFIDALQAYMSAWKERATVAAFLGIGCCHAELGNEEGAVETYDFLLKYNDVGAASILYKLLREKNMLTSSDRTE